MNDLIRVHKACHIKYAWYIKVLRSASYKHNKEELLRHLKSRAIERVNEAIRANSSTEIINDHIEFARMVFVVVQLSRMDLDPNKRLSSDILNSLWAEAVTRVNIKKGVSHQSLFYLPYIV